MNFNQTFPHLVPDAASADALSDDFGRRIKFRVPTEPVARKRFLTTYGTSILEEHTITGVQLNHEGIVCYRAAIDGDSFGRPVDPAMPFDFIT